MSGNSLGSKLVLTSFGESHGKCIGAVLDGCPAGLALDENDIQPMLNLRKPGQYNISTQRQEEDLVSIISGVFRGYTTGAPITMIIWNKDQRSKDYDNLITKIRPGHSDYPALVKYKQFNDFRGGGRFSGRLTATHVLGGSIARKLIKITLGIETNSYTVQIGKIKIKNEPTKNSIESIYSNEVRCPDQESIHDMIDAIKSAKKSGDSVGGIIESVTVNTPVGLGSPIFNSLESDLSRALYSIPSVKGVEFGSGFASSAKFGSKNNDEFTIKNNKIITTTNNAGGILGGLSIGMPIVIRIAFKPTSSISKMQNTVDVETNQNTTLNIKGRHDPCVVPRAPPVVDSLVSLTLADHALQDGFIKPVI